MRKIVTTIHDAKSEMYLNPVCGRTKGQAIREFQQEANNPESQLNKYPEDFTLFELGEYDDITGMMHPHKTPKPIGKALEFLTREQ
ncbi:nonstructural protein [Microviridae sp.]|nr:nonstructural protein [Microviridae sp.]